MLFIICYKKRVKRDKKMFNYILLFFCFFVYVFHQRTIGADIWDAGSRHGLKMEAEDGWTRKKKGNAGEGGKNCG